MKRVIVIASVAILITFGIIMFFVLRNGTSDDLTPDTQHQQDMSDLQDVNVTDYYTTQEPSNERPAPTLRSANDALHGQTPRDGYILAPSIFGITGVDPVSSFFLRTPAEYDTGFPVISIDGQHQPTVTREDSNTFTVTPQIPLSPNSIYIFRLSRDGEDDITWTFQTTTRLEILSTSPRNQATNVPARTGIEISFSFDDVPNIDNHFAIFPHVEGSFTQRGNTAIFMPESPLLRGQIYTVTIRAGLHFPDTSLAISTDHVFSFETSPETDLSISRDLPSRVRFSNTHVQFPSFAAPSVAFWLSYNRNEGRPSVEMSVYRIDDNSRAITAINRLTSIPNWSQLNHADRITDTSELTRVYHAIHIDNREDSRGRRETFSLSETLPPGFYILEAVTDDSIDQVIVQITDLAVQIIADNNKALVWANDMTTGAPAVGAQVFDPITRITHTANDYGITVVERMLSPNEYLVITAEGMGNIVFIRPSEYQTFHSRWDDWSFSHDDWDDWGWSPWISSRSANSHYWAVLQLDRTLFQRSDTVSIWGFIQNRTLNENITYVTAVLTERPRWDLPERDTLHTQNIPVIDGSYVGEIRLPNLDQGFYEIAIFHGDIAVSSMFFEVRDYVTPPYRLSVTASANAVFAGEDVQFIVSTEFFEGTPVPNLDISYRFSGGGLRLPSRDEAQTNIDGVFRILANLSANDPSVQGERRMTFSADATLPEIGETHQSVGVRVFVNDIDVRARASRTGRSATLSVDVHDIDLSRINDGTAESWRDFLGEPKEGQTISVEIIETTWVATRDGERYDHITRQVVPRYRHDRHERSIERFEITTALDGNAEINFQVPDRERASYRARLTTIDGNGRTITHYIFIGRDFSRFFSDAERDTPFLYGVNTEGYDIGDEVELTIMRGIEPVTQGDFLFVVVQDGIMSYHVGSNTLRFNFDQRHAPNAQVFAYHFNGHTYHTDGQMTQRLLFNPTSRNINIDISMTQNAYRPGDESTFTITTTDMYGNPKSAIVNISLVDEALFALMDYTVDTLAMLYANVSDRLRFSMATHRTFVSDGIYEWLDAEVEWEAEFAYLPEGGSAMARARAIDGEDGRIRERFEDTAFFASVRTNERGEATLTVPLPDNITSWRVTASAVSDDLHAGNSVQNLRVTQPMFLHYSLGRTFLVGDFPYIGVNAYGSDLSGGEQVLFEVWHENAPTDIRSATGEAFERINIPLWEMEEEGFDSIVIRATVGNFSDSVRHSYQVRSSHHLVDTAIFYEVTADTVFDVNPGGLTNITFTDLGRGQFLNDLVSLRRELWRSGARIEGLIARREIFGLMQTHFPDTPFFGEPGNFDTSEYQTETGGIAVLPYAEADVKTTVLLIPFISDDVNLIALREYLRDVYNNSAVDHDRMIALYGLALLGEPVLLDLQNYAMLQNLSVRSSAYVALGLAAIGELQAARELYNRNIAPHIQQLGAYYRVNVGASSAEILDATTIVSILAAKLGMPESIGLYNYSVRYRFDAPSRFEDDALHLVIERLLFIYYEIDNHTDVDAGITYSLFGETVTRELGRGRQFTLRIPAEHMEEFNLISTTGEVGAVSIVRMPLDDIETVRNDMTVRREFFRAGTNISSDTFEQGELVRVQITIEHSERDLSGSFEITDFLPAGLVHVANSARSNDTEQTEGRWVRAIVEGQRITFFAFNNRFDQTNVYYYYARIISPGTFMAEGTFVQSRGAREFMVVGEDMIITISPSIKYTPATSVDPDIEYIPATSTITAFILPLKALATLVIMFSLRKRKGKTFDG